MYTLKVEDPDKLFMTSDSHFNHFNICKYCHRPFTSRSEMDQILVENWNSVVPEDGIVVHCGDFMLPHDMGTKEYERFWKKLNFKTLLHLRGNHDRIECGDYEFEGKTIIVRDVAMIYVDDIKIYAQHYPCATFNGDYHVYGHIHTLADGSCYGIDNYVTKIMKKNSYDVGVDQNGYKPISYWELCEIFKKRIYGNDTIIRLDDITDQQCAEIITHLFNKKVIGDTTGEIIIHTGMDDIVIKKQPRLAEL